MSDLLLNGKIHLVEDNSQHLKNLQSRFQENHTKFLQNSRSSNIQKKNNSQSQTKILKFQLYNLN